MIITARKLTDKTLVRLACEATMDNKSKVTLDTIYKCEHSPIRTQMFWIELRSIPSFVSVHLVRHKIGVEHFVKSLREDRCGNGTENRNTLTNHSMLINAQSLINMARKRLCLKASKETVEVMEHIKKSIRKVDPYLYKYMVKDCQYRNGCNEIKSCGWWNPDAWNDDYNCGGSRRLGPVGNIEICKVEEG